MNLGLRNKKAVVCGSTQGIGKSIAEELALQGVSITLIARNQNALKEVTSSLDVSLGQKHDFLCVDFSANNFSERINSLTQDYDILINNTGGPASGPITDAQPADFENAFKRHSNGLGGFKRRHRGCWALQTTTLVQTLIQKYLFKGRIVST